MTSALFIFGTLLAGLAIGAGGVAVIWWALFRDTSRGRRRCPACWHNLDHSPGLTCGECGHAAATVGALHRTRRRWGIAAVAFVSIIAITVWVRITVTDAGLESLAPNAALVRLAPYMEPPSALDAGWRELARRIRRREVSESDLVVLASTLAGTHDAGAFRPHVAAMLRDVLRLVHDAPGASPPASAAEQVAHLEKQRAHSAALDRAIAGVPPHVVLTLPTQAVRGAPLLVSLAGTLWGQQVEWRAMVATARATPIDGGAAVNLAPGGSQWVTWSGAAALRLGAFTPAVVELESLPDGEHRVEATLRVQSRRWDWGDAAWGPWVDSPDATAASTVRGGERIELQAFDDATLRAGIRAAFDNPVIAWATDTHPVSVRYRGLQLPDGEFDSLLVGVILELREHGEVRRSSRFWWPVPHGQPTRSRIAGWSIDYEDAAALRRLRDDATGWTMHVRGDRRTALRAFDPSTMTAPTLRYWNGALEFPLAVERTHRPNPGRVWQYRPVADD